MKAIVCATAIVLALQGVAAAQDNLSVSMLGANSTQPSTETAQDPFLASMHEAQPWLSFEVTPWDQLGLKGPEILHLVRQGAVNISALVLAYNSGEISVTEGIDIPLVAVDEPAVQQVIADYGPTLQSYYESAVGVKLLGLYPHPPQLLFCREELKSLADLKGRKVRVSSAGQASVVRHVGGVDANIAFGEMQTALQTGVVDCGITAATAGYKTGWHEASAFIYNLPINWQVAGYAANLGWWNGLQPEQQAVLEASFTELVGKLSAEHRAEQALGLACLSGQSECSLGESGRMTIIEPAEADIGQSRIDALEQSVLPRWASACGAECVVTWNETVGTSRGFAAR